MTRYRVKEGTGNTCCATGDQVILGSVPLAAAWSKQSRRIAAIKELANKTAQPDLSVNAGHLTEVHALIIGQARDQEREVTQGATHAEMAGVSTDGMVKRIITDTLQCLLPAVVADLQSKS